MRLRLRLERISRIEREVDARLERISRIEREVDARLERLWAEYEREAREREACPHMAISG